MYTLYTVMEKKWHYLCGLLVDKERMHFTIASFYTFVVDELSLGI